MAEGRRAMDRLLLRAYLRTRWFKTGSMAKDAPRKITSSARVLTIRDGSSGRFLTSKTGKNSAGSALSQTERVKKAFRDTNAQTHTFKPKNAG